MFKPQPTLHYSQTGRASVLTCLSAHIRPAFLRWCLVVLVRYLSILRSLLGPLQCAFEDAEDGYYGASGAASPATGAEEAGGEDVAANALDAFAEQTCLAGFDGRLSAGVALLGLLFYLPSALLVAIGFLNDEKDDNLDVRFVVAFEVLNTHTSA